MNHIKNLILDMDGVLWHGDTAVPGLAHFFQTLRQREINFVLATNNASKTPAQYVTKLAGFGVPVKPEQILTSAIATADYLQEEYAADTHALSGDVQSPTEVAVYVLGGDGLHQAVQERGFRVLSVADVMEGGQRAAVTAVGLWREATYADFAAAAICINHGAHFIGSNPDVSLPSEYGPLPGAGSFLALLTAATGVQPTIIGKPGIIMFQEALKRLGSIPADTAMVGDRLSTDIAGGKAAGLPTILVLSGISTLEELAQAHVPQPDFVFANIVELAQRLEIGD